MARPKIKRKGVDWKALLLSEEKDLLRGAVQEMVQEILESEMDETVGARKGERTGGRTGYRSGYYSRGLVTRVGKLELRVPQDRQGLHAGHDRGNRRVPEGARLGPRRRPDPGRDRPCRQAHPTFQARRLRASARAPVEGALGAGDPRR